MFLDAEIGPAWCAGLTWRCSPVEAAGLWMVALFYTIILMFTTAHKLIMIHKGTAVRNEEACRRNATAGSDGGNSDMALLLLLVFWFFGFVGSCLVWVAAGVRYVHVQWWPAQLLGCVVLMGCIAVFIAVHVNLGDSWSPVPEALAEHKLITHGVFRWSRHPMYSAFLWATIGTGLATLNWCITWCMLGLPALVLSRVKTEERIMEDLFGPEYQAYCRRVSALGPPWCCLGFDRNRSGYQQLD
eukprot:gene11172-2026_t